jgi:hypothetical protein
MGDLTRAAWTRRCGAGNVTVVFVHGFLNDNWRGPGRGDRPGTVPAPTLASGAACTSAATPPACAPTAPANATRRLNRAHDASYQ